MDNRLKKFFEIFAVFSITFVVMVSSSFNIWTGGTFTMVQRSILDFAHSVRDGYSAYVELEGHYGPVIYELVGLGYLVKASNTAHYLIEFVIVFFSTYFMYKTAKLYTSIQFSIGITLILMVFGWGDLTHAGAEQLVFFFMVALGYHIARQLQRGFLSYHVYLMAIEMTLMFFLQPGYALIWVVMLAAFAVKFIRAGMEKAACKSFFLSIIEGIVTVTVPMALYFLYFQNATEFFEMVVLYNYSRLGSLLEGMKVIWNMPWIIIIPIFIIVTIVKLIQGEDVKGLFFWMDYMIVAFIVIALQGDNLASELVLTKALYVVPLASVFSLADKRLGFQTEERVF
ncbi:hypothetical protein [Pseudobutyrivibrio xylanivorans]|uniref:Uncharacterized protein n=1 Tax=Pseudobutyrivibrio xylanivorans TaxID=185007 RepID=A0A5P6VTG1_PSEXY|nr:hypothetical protein [Pseudobutyrivibrio xylanivorans]QFJ55877.1 hypothetical protein FXF36_13770 [Pseudobutyrivibrio xylanivorans]